ncbi:LamG-like jellyroll fold domain-containing protein [Marinimicrobium alkaliphilum]|uniref:LamG-like jellyroll fold domain-containing protein n=1 Tax=Marinimicrobium alkaliphilum TaxID=2202654 RepID=UPI000DBA65EA|nr:LamG-like jellyroll fold domain-containing protein [Marinimicrobium alkaliphilum]
MKIQRALGAVVWAGALALGLSACSDEGGSGSDFTGLHLTYEEGRPLDAVSAFDVIERVPGIEGQALRTDGFSSWVETDLAFDSLDALTLETWVILESHPSDREVPYDQLQPSAFISQTDGEQGFAIEINTYGQWAFALYLDGDRHEVAVLEPFPVYEWTHIAATFDGSRGVMALYLNGESVGEASVPSGARVRGADVPLFVGKSSFDRYMIDVFLVNALNGAFDETRVLDRALDSEAVAARYRDGADRAADLTMASLVVSPERFAGDLQRPRYHAMPPANWTNEPHGLVQVDGHYHMYYQRTPNGPFKTKMHWGHMSSGDLVNWVHRRDALWPTLEDSDNYGFDMKGIWSGDVVYHDGKGYALYTSANYDGPRQHTPMISLAVSEDEHLDYWDKRGPVIDARDLADYRDPYIFRENGWWHLIVGAKIEGVGGVDYYRSQDLVEWERQPRFTSLPFEQMDIQSDVWEMPVFERLDGDTFVLVVNPVGNKVHKYDEQRPTRPIYWTGQFVDGQFHPDYPEGKNLDIIFGHLSPSVTRTEEGELVGIGIIDERRSLHAQKDAGWAHTFSLPRQWKLMPDRETLGQEPVAALRALRQQSSHREQGPKTLAGRQAVEGRGRQRELIVTFDPDSGAARYGIELGVADDRSEFTRLLYDANSREFILDKRASSQSETVEDKVVYRGDYDEQAFGKPETFHIFIDHSVIDVFINDAATIGFRIYPERPDSDQVNLVAEEGELLVEQVESWDIEAPPQRWE